MITRAAVGVPSGCIADALPMPCPAIIMAVCCSVTAVLAGESIHECVKSSLDIWQWHAL